VGSEQSGNHSVQECSKEGVVKPEFFEASKQRWTRTLAR
jgi:hypothetical protein